MDANNRDPVAPHARPLDAAEAVVDPKAAAEHAGLTYVSDERPGVRRERKGKGFRYVSADGGKVDDVSTLRRIKSLAIPPAWTDVWICKSANGHIQATGRDAKGRKQYRYHARFREVREGTKYHRMLAFAESLPAIRQKVNEHLALRGLPREKVLATVVHLLEATLIRVGSDEYAKQNKSYGLTTLKNRHVEVNGSELRLQLQGQERQGLAARYPRSTHRQGHTRLSGASGTGAVSIRGRRWRNAGCDLLGREYVPQGDQR